MPTRIHAPTLPPPEFSIEDAKEADAAFASVIDASRTVFQRVLDHPTASEAARSRAKHMVHALTCYATFTPYLTGCILRDFIHSVATPDTPPLN